MTGTRANEGLAQAPPVDLIALALAVLFVESAECVPRVSGALALDTANPRRTASSGRSALGRRGC